MFKRLKRVQSGRDKRRHDTDTERRSAVSHFSEDSGIFSMDNDIIQDDSQLDVAQAQNWENEAIVSATHGALAAAVTRPLTRMSDCKKHATHDQFVPVKNLRVDELPSIIQTEKWCAYIKSKSGETVRLVVSHTSKDRPRQFEGIKGNHRTGSGTAFVMEMANEEDCECAEVEGPHKISGIFRVMTAAHVVFNDDEAQQTRIEFFFDDDEDKSGVVRAHGIRVSHVDIDKNRSVIECRTHDLTLCERLEEARKRREQLREDLQNSSRSEELVILISHPHGQAKHVSFGQLKELQTDGEVKTTSDGTQIIGCIMYFTSPSCPGSGGGTVNVLGGGEICKGFAPHCASYSNGENVSGLGWIKYSPSLQRHSTLQLRN